MAALSRKDYERALDIAVGFVTRFEPAGPPWRQLCEELVETLDLSLAGMMEVYRPTWTMGGRTWPEEFGRPVDWDPSLVRAHPLVRHYSATADPMPRSITDVVEAGRWRNSPV